MRPEVIDTFSFAQAAQKIRMPCKLANRRSRVMSPNGSGAERRATIGDPRSGPSAPNASARATGYVFRPRMLPAADPRVVAASATTSAGRTAPLKRQPTTEACNRRGLLENKKALAATRCARLTQLRKRLDAGAALQQSSPSTRRHNGSGVERRGRRLLPSVASQKRAPASARTTG